MALDRAPLIEWPLWWESFWELNTMRPKGFGLFEVPLDRIYWYADEVLQLDALDKRAFVWIMRVVDARFVQLENEKAEKANKSK